MKREAQSGGFERERATGGCSAVFPVPGQRTPLNIVDVSSECVGLIKTSCRLVAKDEAKRTREVGGREEKRQKTMGARPSKEGVPTRTCHAGGASADCARLASDAAAPAAAQDRQITNAPPRSLQFICRTVRPRNSKHIGASPAAASALPVSAPRQSFFFMSALQRHPASARAS
jgi:hypothetical protein